MQKIDEEPAGEFDTNFATTVECALNTRIAFLESSVAAYTASIADSELKITEEFRVRDQLKTSIQKNKKKIAEEEKILHSFRIANRLAEENLSHIRAEAKAAEERTLKYEQCHVEMIKTYSELWKKTEAEYERHPLAIAREQSRLEIDDLQSMIDEKMKEIKQTDEWIAEREAIARKELHEISVNCAQLYQDNQQESNEINKITKEIEGLEENLRELVIKNKEVQEELKKFPIPDKVVEVPRPRFIIQGLETFNNPMQQLSNIYSGDYLQPTLPSESRDMSDSASINTVMYEEILVRSRGKTTMMHSEVSINDEQLNPEENIERQMTNEICTQPRDEEEPSEAGNAMDSRDDGQRKPAELPPKKVKFNEQHERPKPIITNVESVPGYMMSRFLVPSSSAMDVDNTDDGSVMTHDSENFPNHSQGSDSISDVTVSEGSGQLFRRDILTPPPLEESHLDSSVISESQQAPDVVSPGSFFGGTIKKNTGATLYSNPAVESEKKRDPGYINLF